MTSGYKAKVAVVAAIVFASALGAYLALNLPSQSPSGSGLLVYSNKVVVYDIPGFSSPYSSGIWQLELGNGGSSPLYATYQILENGYMAYGNSTKLQPGQRASIASCLQGPITPSTSFDVPIFVTNTTGTVVPHYPPTLIHTTQAPFSGQFSTTSTLRVSVYDPQLGRNVSTWTIAVTNTGKEPIQFLMATLWNGSHLIESPQLRCAGSVPYVSGFPTDYGQPLSPGQTANGTGFMFYANTVILPGRTYKAEIIAVYADHSEVVQSSQVQAVT